MAGQEYGCGQCLPCRINRQRLWAARLVWEWYTQGSGLFVTLTYSDLWVPEELEPKHLTDYLKRLRKRIQPQKLRYFGVGEYGELTWRPHFHLCIFPSVEQKAIVECWKFGMVHIGLVEEKSIGYITHYCTKGLATLKSGLQKRREFARMSLKPGIGAGVVDTMPLRVNGLAMVDVLNGQDVPAGCMVQGKLVPYGRYLKRRLRNRLGIGSIAPEGVRSARSREYLELGKCEKEMQRRRDERQLHADSAKAKFELKRLKRSI